MTERNPYSQYSFDTMDRGNSPRRRRAESFGERVVSRLTNPIFATGALLVTAAAFAGIIIASYPDAEEVNIPTIHADAGMLREQPEDRGGFQVAHQDSTVFSSIRSTALEESAPVEDLLAQEKPIDKLEAFAKEAESMFDSAKTPQPAEITAFEEEGSEAPSVIEITERTPEITSGTPANDNAASAAPVKMASAEKPVPAPAVKPGRSPETLAFVKSVLDEKDDKAAGRATSQAVDTQTSVTQPDRIEPAAGGAASTAAKAISGSYYVQLASVTSESGANGEWKKLQKTFSALSGAQYRVQRADVSGGTRYRIQAGPMSKEMAADLCNSIKAQKPGGCLVVK